MRIIIAICIIVCTLPATAQLYDVFYTCAKSGLPLRELPSRTAKLIEKIPYGTKVTPIYSETDTMPLQPEQVEGMRGYWKKVRYNNKTGYIVDTYLLPWPPPKATTKEMKQYFSQVTSAFGNKLNISSGNMNNISEGGWRLTKQLYKNGAEWHQHQGYEYHADTYILPGFNLQQGFILLRLLPEFKDVFAADAAFPTENQTRKLEYGDYKITVERESQWFDNNPPLRRIVVQFEQGAYYSFEIFTLEGQLVISFGGGV
jgi:hypothetical protein